MAEKCVKYYYSSVSAMSNMRKHQQEVEDYLEAHKINYEKIDIADPSKDEEKKFMRANAQGKDGKTPLPPQLFLDDEYLGDYEAFSLAKEEEQIEAFFKMAPKTDVSQAEGKAD